MSANPQDLNPKGGIVLALWLAFTVFNVEADEPPDPIARSSADYLETITDLKKVWAQLLAQETVSRGSQAKGSKQEISIDPWASEDQETHFLPSLPPVERADPLGNQLLEPLEPQSIVTLIPPIYRLAEALGLGTNRVHWEAHAFDPTLVSMPGRPISYHTKARLRYLLIGQYQSQSGEPLATPIITFQGYRDSRSYVDRSIVSTDLPWSVDHYRLLNYSIRRMTSHASPPWKNEQLHQDLSNRLILLKSPAQEAAATQKQLKQLRDQIQAVLGARRVQIAMNLLDPSQSASLGGSRDTWTKALQTLDQKHQRLAQLLQDSGHQAQLCLRDELALLPSSTSVDNWLKASTKPSNQASPPPWQDHDQVQSQLLRWANHCHQHRRLRP